VEPAITFAPGGVAILSTQTAYNLRCAFLPALSAHFLRVRITIVSKQPFEYRLEMARE